MRRFTPILCAAVTLTSLCPSAIATSMMESFRSALTIDFENGDSLIVHCESPDDPCVLRMNVNGKEFEYDSSQLGAEPLPEHANLYSGLFSGRDEYFSFSVSVLCPDVEQTRSYNCEVGGVVSDGELGQVRLGRKRETNVRESGQ